MDNNYEVKYSRRQTMTSRERVLTTLSLNIPDRVPKDFWGFNREAQKIFEQKTGSDDPAEYFDIDVRYVEVKDTEFNLEEYHKYHRQYLSPSTVINEWGTAFVPGSDPAFDHFVAPLVWAESAGDIEKYPLPDLFEGYRYEHLPEEIAGIQSRGYAAVAAMACTIFEVAWQIRGFNELMTDFVLNPIMAQCLLDRIVELRCYQAKKFAEADVDVLHIGDDVGMQDRLMMSPDTWRKWLKPRLAKVINSARKGKPDLPVFYHSDGYIEQIIPDLIEIGVTALNPIQPECMDPAKLKREYGKNLAFWGTVGTQTTFPFGTPEEVKEVVKERIRTVGAGGGLIISPTHSLEPEVPWENILAFFEAIEECGYY